MNRSKIAAFSAVLVVFFAAASVAFGDVGISEDEILVGQSCALTGPAGALGSGMKVGMEAYFEKVNAEGGIQGRKIRLVSKDDGYEPVRAIANTRQLIESEKVFALLGEVGTPTSTAVVPIAEDAKVPFFGPFTGAEFLRNPYRRYVINVRGSYYQEMERLAQYLVDEQGLNNIACFYQNDGYGQAGLKGIELALAKRSLEISATGTYERNTVAVKSGLLKIRKAKPDAVIMVGAYKPCAEFIKLAKRVGLSETVFCNISFVGTDALKKELGDAGEGCVISQVVRFPWDDSIALVKEYQETMQQFRPDTEIGFVSLEGYMVAKLFCDAVKGVDGDLTRENFIDTINRIGKFDLGNETLEYGPQDHQGMDQVFLTIINNGEIESL